MRLRFLGTRGEIELRSTEHRRHSALLAGRVLVDCGLDWLGELDGLRPRAIILTHAHPDHAGGLRHGAPCPVWATDETWAAIRRYPVEDRHVLAPRRGVDITGLRFEAFPVEHSVRAPAVALRIGGRVLYAPDVVAFPDAAAFAGIELYIGDGAAITRAIVRYRDGVPIGHASIRTQLDWCAEHGVARAVFTHCGSQIVRAHDAAAEAVAALAGARGVQSAIAHDGLEVRA